VQIPNWDVVEACCKFTALLENLMIVFFLKKNVWTSDGRYVDGR